MKKALLSALVLGTTVAAVVACTSGGSGGGGPGAVSSVDSSKSLGSLSDSEAEQYCRDAQNYQKNTISDADMKKVSCGITGRVFGSFGAKDDAEAQAKCREQFDACMAKPDTTPDAGGDNDDGCGDFKQRLSECNATVAEANQCVADTGSAYQAMASKDPCADAKASSPDGGLSGESFFEQPASCKTLQDKCPSLSDG